MIKDEYKIGEYINPVSVKVIFELSKTAFDKDEIFNSPSFSHTLELNSNDTYYITSKAQWYDKERSYKYIIRRDISLSLYLEHLERLVIKHSREYYDIRNLDSNSDEYKDRLDSMFDIKD